MQNFYNQSQTSQTRLNAILVNWLHFSMELIRLTRIPHFLLRYQRSVLLQHIFYFLEHRNDLKGCRSTETDKWHAWYLKKKF